MAKLVSITSDPQFSNAEIKRMIEWLMSVVRNELESATTRKDACVATLSMAELFEMGDGTKKRLNNLFVMCKRAESHCQAMRERPPQTIA
jgi:hypothetical protein